MGGEDDWDDTNTEMYVEAKVIDPVARVADLPKKGISEGALCFVDEDQGVYKYRGGKWVRRSTRKG